MGKVIKDLLKSTVISIGMALTIFSLIGVYFDITNGGNFSLDGYLFTKMVIGSAVVGIGFGVPTVVYNDLYRCSICGRMVRRCLNDRAGSCDRRDPAFSCFYHLVLFQQLLP